MSDQRPNEGQPIDIQQALESLKQVSDGTINLSNTLFANIKQALMDHRSGGLDGVDADESSDEDEEDQEEEEVHAESATNEETTQDVERSAELTANFRSGETTQDGETNAAEGFRLRLAYLLKKNGIHNVTAGGEEADIPSANSSGGETTKQSGDDVEQPSAEPTSEEAAQDGEEPAAPPAKTPSTKKVIRITNSDHAQLTTYLHAAVQNLEAWAIEKPPHQQKARLLSLASVIQFTASVLNIDMDIWEVRLDAVIQNINQNAEFQAWLEEEERLEVLREELGRLLEWEEREGLKEERRRRKRGKREARRREKREVKDREEMEAREAREMEEGLVELKRKDETSARLKGEILGQGEVHERLGRERGMMEGMGEEEWKEAKGGEKDGDKQSDEGEEREKHENE